MRTVGCAVATFDYAAYLKSLNPGEAGVIALAKHMNGIAALDDLDARKVFGKENIRLTGTLGIVKVGYELLGFISTLRSQRQSAAVQF